MNLEDLPCEVLSMITEYLVGKDILVFEGLARLFRSICKDPVIWKRKIINEFPGEITSKSSNFKKMYLEFCFYTWFSINILLSNNYVDDFQLIRNSDIDNGILTFCVYNTSVSISKNGMITNLMKKMTPPENKVLALKSNSFDNTTVYPENRIIIPYLHRENVYYLICQNDHLEIKISRKIIKDGFKHYSMIHHLYGEQIKRGLEYVYVLISIYYCSNEYVIDNYNQELANDCELNYIGFFESLEDIEKWMKSGNLCLTSRIIEDTKKDYAITRSIVVNDCDDKYCHHHWKWSQETTKRSYSQLTFEILKGIRCNSTYKLDHGECDEFSKDYFEIMKLPVKEDSSFNFRKLPSH